MNRLTQTYRQTNIYTQHCGVNTGNPSSDEQVQWTCEPKPSEFPTLMTNLRAEKDSETGLSYFGARYYEPEMLNIWLSVDPMADKYPILSPYCYCAWNPVKLVDPDGRDWYQAEDGTVCWNKGNSATHIVNGVEYKNIGSTYSFTNGNIIYNYNQNRVESIGLSNATSADFPIQVIATEVLTKSLSERVSDLEWTINQFMQHSIGDYVAKIEDKLVEKSQAFFCGLAVAMPIIGEVNAIITMIKSEDIFGNLSGRYDYLLSTLSF